ncbi:MAG TPA: endonuclease MutS2, partial [Clostridia bacterium]|nr:endonuclease MutS2 [Clostridia bacterium]
MKESTLKTLEFDKVVKKLSDMAASEAGKSRCLQLRPCCSMEEVEALQQATAECIKALVKKGSPPLGGVADLSPVIKRVEAGGILDTEQLLAVSDLLR